VKKISELTLLFKNIFRKMEEKIMANEDKFAKTIDDAELDEVAGGTNAEFNEIRNIVGMPKGSLDAVRAKLAGFGIEVQHWKAGGFLKSEGQAMYRALDNRYESISKGGKGSYLKHSEVVAILKEKLGTEATSMGETDDGWTLVGRTR